MRYTFIALLFVAACADRTVVAPDVLNIDGVYHVRLEYKENTCDRDWGPQAWTDLYNVQLMVDGTYDFAPYRDGVVSWPLSFSKVFVDNYGGVGHSEQWRSGLTSHDFTNTLTGHIDHAFLDFTMTLNWENRDNTTPCQQTIHATGERWRVADPKAVEGMYLVMVSGFVNDLGHQYICDNQSQQEVLWQNFQLTVSAPENDDVKLDFYFGGMRLHLPIVAGVPLSPQAQMWFGLVGWQDVQSQVTGKLTPDLVDIDLRMDPWNIDMCYYRFHIVGKRVLPGETLTGEFRAVTVAQDQCTGADQITRDDNYVVIEQDDGWVQMYDRSASETQLQPLADGSFSSTVFEGNGKATYDGSITPDDLNFYYTFKNDSETRDCGITRDVSAVPRFVN